VPEHVLERGHNRQPLFFRPDDYRVYLQCLHDAPYTAASCTPMP
jgi:hypothetical protein